MSFNRTIGSLQRAPISVGSKGKKKAKTTEESHPTPEEYIYREVIGDRILMQTARMRKKNPSLELLPQPLELPMSQELRESHTPHLHFPLCIWGHNSVYLPSSSHEPQLGSFEVSFGEIKEEQKKLGQQLENLAIDMKTGFDDIKKLFAAHDEHFILLDKDVRLLKH
ncbi:hypothetical protein CJ030_MR8G020278 [Morella rubra]|uniref:Uncharacterized protein n=1 Tax=Morella rubra TaxID=262757 RepID=A0A6A1US71_9ROSI|nr:hypothetical protein CJ030_MR8G020278 [Morella rubra]